jgi:5-methylcytosine-specific restriction endonuclease McrA
MSDSRPRMRVAPIPCTRLRKEILARDNWRCQARGCFRNLDVHHLRQRSALGADTEANLITLCRDCHEALHRTNS